MKLLTSLVAALLALGLLAACGGDDDGGEALSLEDYSEQAEAELKAFSEEFGPLGEEARDPESREDYLQAVTAVQDRVTETIDTLDGLEPPEEAAAVHDDLLAAFNDLEAAFTPVIEATEAEDDAALQQAAEDLTAESQEFDSTAQQIQQDAEEAGVEIPSLTGADT